VIRPPPQPVELRRICDFQGQRRDALIGVNQRPACIGIHPLCASPQGFLDQRLPETRLAPVTRTALPSIVIASISVSLLGPVSRCCWFRDSARQDVAAERVIWTAVRALAVARSSASCERRVDALRWSNLGPLVRALGARRVTSAAQPPNGTV
jgi:hypothetical protein